MGKGDRSKHMHNQVNRTAKRKTGCFLLVYTQGFVMIQANCVNSHKLHRQKYQAAELFDIILAQKVSSQCGRPLLGRGDGRYERQNNLAVPG